MQINTAIETQQLKDELYEKNNLTVSAARLDKLHPIVSGNKFFKLKYNIENALFENSEGIITFGGAYSNHLAATAFACHEAGIRSIAILRGEESVTQSHTLVFCKQMGMQLEFVNRTDYRNKEKLYQHYRNRFPSFYIIPEGGDNEAGEKGCSEIITNIEASHQYTHIVCDVGTGTTFKGMAKSIGSNQMLLGIVVLKGAEEMNPFLAASKNTVLIHDYHFGGYAKKTKELIAFMNQFYRQHHVPTDFVYTGKLFFALNDLITKKYFNNNSKILCIHTGGLQGNLSLPPGTLNF
ncbi:MAG: pyridoxal-phosphate dependent enzyme [Sphingobacteriales bacterium]|nr:pyridoxal-phosphate dependent enzyme [Sphingobacteriales bacterium]